MSFLLLLAIVVAALPLAHGLYVLLGSKHYVINQRLKTYCTREKN